MSSRCPYCKEPVTRKDRVACNLCHDSWKRREHYNPLISLWHKFLYRKVA
jgi:hypothetical protein